MRADMIGRSSQTKAIQHERIRGALARFRGVEQSPEWPTLPFIVQATTNLGLGLCFFALGEEEKSQNHIEKFKRNLDESENNKETLNTLLANCALLASGFAFAGFKNTALFAAKIIEDKHNELQLRYLREIAQHSYWMGSIAKSVGELERALQSFSEAKKAAEDAGEKGFSSGCSFHIGEIQMKLGDLEEAVENFQKCLKLNPAHRKAQAHLDKLIRERSDA